MFSWFEKHNKISWTVTILIAITMFYLSSITFHFPAGAQKTNLLSIIYHIVAYFFLSLFLFTSSLKKKKELSFLVILILFLYAVLDELHQFFVPGRSCSLSDLFIDGTGIILAFLTYVIVKIKQFKNTFFLHSL